MAVAWPRPLADDPSILAAISPDLRRALSSCDHGMAGLVALGAVFLAVTGAEALYADMGHFGRRPIQFAWFALVLPALALNYLGQGALAARPPREAGEPVLPALPGLGAAADGRPGHDGDRHRQPGRDHGRVLAHPAGDPARLAAAVRDPAHLRDREGPDLHPAHQLAPAAGGRVPGDRVPVVERAGGGLRHRGHRHDGGHGAPRLLRAVEVLEMAGSDSRPPDRALPRHRRRVPARQPAQGLARAAGCRSRSVPCSWS